MNNKKGLNGSDIAANIGKNMISEFIGTFFLVLIGTGVAIEATLNQTIAGSPLNSLSVAFAFGLVLVVLVNTFGHVSGAHFNPAVSIALAITNKFPWKSVIPYVIAQLLGALFASLALFIIFGSAVRDQTFLGATYPSSSISIWAALFIETIATFLLMIVIMAVATDERSDGAVTGLSIGLALFVGVLFAGTLTGGALNPARALGPMIASGNYSNFWIYIIGPVAGSTGASLIYDKVIKKAEPPQDAEDDKEKTNLI